MPGVSTREMPDSTGEGQVDSCSLLLLIDYLSSGIKIVSLCVRHLLKENFSNPFCDNSLSLPVEEWRAKLGQGRKLFLRVHDKSMSWNYCTRRALAYNDEPEKGEGDQGELRDDNEKPVFKKYKKGLKVQQKYLSVVGSGPTRMSGKSWKIIWCFQVSVPVRQNVDLADEIANHGGFPCAVLPCNKEREDDMIWRQSRKTSKTNTRREIMILSC